MDLDFDFLLFLLLDGGFFDPVLPADLSTDLDLDFLDFFLWGLLRDADLLLDRFWGDFDLN